MLIYSFVKTKIDGTGYLYRLEKEASFQLINTIAEDLLK
jgi:hypothetical protein